MQIHHTFTVREDEWQSVKCLEAVRKKTPNEEINFTELGKTFGLGQYGLLFLISYVNLSF